MNPTPEVGCPTPEADCLRAALTGIRGSLLAQEQLVLDSLLSGQPDGAEATRLGMSLAAYAHCRQRLLDRLRAEYDRQKALGNAPLMSFEEILQTIGVADGPSPADPPPAPPNSASDWEWAFAARESGALQSYCGQHVVVHQQHVIAADPDADVALRRAAEQTGAPNRELVVLFVDDPQTEGWLHVR